MKQIEPLEQVSASAVLDSLVMAGRMVEQRVEEALQPHGLSAAKLSALEVLAGAEEPMALGVLSHRLHCVRSNITQLVDRLEAEKLVRRVPDAEDRRSVRAAITQEGRNRYEAGCRALREVQSQMLRLLPRSEQETLARIVGRLLAGGK
jgi:DNA-binding MarR family transcriptional regulator